MDLDKLTVFVKSLGFPVVMSVWFLWKIQAFMDTMIVQQATVIELLNQLIRVHK